MRVSRWIAAAIIEFGISAVAAPAAVTKMASTPALDGAAEILDQRLSTIEKEVVPAAEAMPEERYSFAPTAGEFAGVRTFAEEVKHLAAANWQLGAPAVGEDPPAGTKDEAAPESVRTKAQILDYLKGSFACLHRAVAASAGEKLIEPIVGTKGTWQRTRLGRLIDAFAHASNHYGQIVEYLRMNGIIPPASR